MILFAYDNISSDISSNRRTKLPEHILRVIILQILAAEYFIALIVSEYIKIVTCYKDAFRTV